MLKKNKIPPLPPPNANRTPPNHWNVSSQPYMDSCGRAFEAKFPRPIVDWFWSDIQEFAVVILTEQKTQSQPLSTRGQGHAKASKAHKDFRVPNHIWLQNRIAPYSRVSTDSESWASENSDMSSEETSCYKETQMQVKRTQDNLSANQVPPERRDALHKSLFRHMELSGWSLGLRPYRQSSIHIERTGIAFWREREVLPVQPIHAAGEKLFLKSIGAALQFQRPIGIVNVQSVSKTLRVKNIT